MKLSEVLSQKDQLKLAHSYLKKHGWDATLGSIWVKVDGASFSVNVFWDERTDNWMVVWYLKGRKVDTNDNLSFDEVVKLIEPLKSSEKTE